MDDLINNKIAEQMIMAQQKQSDNTLDQYLYRTTSEQPNMKQNILTMKCANIIEVWNHNLEEEVYKIIDLIERHEFNIVSVDTEFPGVAVKPQKFNEDSDFEYQIIRENVNQLKVIQIGITLSNKNGEIIQTGSSWQFNFKYDLQTEKYHPEAIQLLKNSGINFEIMKQRGIDPLRFAELLLTSNIVLNEDIQWVCFHGGFDFSYFMRLLINENLPESQSEFTEQLTMYFPNFYDLKYLIKDHETYKHGGLNKLAADLDVERIGPKHQAGSDSLLTLAIFFKLQQHLQKDVFKEGKNIVYGIGVGFVENKEYLWNYKMNMWNEINTMNEQMNMYYNYPYMNQVITNPYYQQQPQFQQIYVGQQNQFNNYYQHQMQHQQIQQMQNLMGTDNNNPNMIFKQKKTRNK